MDKEKHDKWFREQVEAELAEADKPGAEFVSHEDVGVRWAKKRDALLDRACRDNPDLSAGEVAEILRALDEAESGDVEPYTPYKDSDIS